MSTNLQIVERWLEKPYTGWYPIEFDRAELTLCDAEALKHLAREQDAGRELTYRNGLEFSEVLARLTKLALVDDHYRISTNVLEDVVRNDSSFAYPKRTW